ncbi:hypothetical protein chiPu_0013109 [Chiloscyllium punctatum]|uniref:Exonuclease domain-containing protein n=1 Tax=Chiloscyllium punctatum TaxID=137246 RepID=A0A401SW57_CHIPU|nr:hypothetical protein [Chiloscyllium punctatum]
MSGRALARTWPEPARVERRDLRESRGPAPAFGGIWGLRSASSRLCLSSRFSIRARAPGDRILKILKGKIVVGHALHNDFKALKYFHPKSLVRDTCKIPLLKRKVGFPERESVSLKNLAKLLLGKSIQVGHDGHCSVEDACTSMELYQRVESQWEQKLCDQLSVANEQVASETNFEISQYMDDQYWPTDLHQNSKWSEHTYIPQLSQSPAKMKTHAAV